MAFKKQGNSREDRSARPSGRPSRDGEASKRSSYNKDNSTPSRFKKSDSDTNRPAKKYGAGSRPDSKPYGAGRGRKTESGAAGDHPFKKFEKQTTDRSTRRRDEQEDNKRPFRSRSTSSEGGYTNKRNSDRTNNDRPYGTRSRTAANGERPERKTEGTENRGSRPNTRPFRERQGSTDERPARVMRSRNKKADETEGNSHASDNGLIRLNRYISNAGICSRRKADELIAAGVVSVNGEVVSELGYKVDPSKDVIRYNGETLKREKMVYVLLNKPKDYITTTDDPQERRTVMQLVDKASKERIYPIGRLDRNTTGLLLMTNDGDLADKLSHPRNNITKIYQVELSKSLTQGDLNKIAFGVELEDGLIKPDMVTYVQGGSKREIGIQIHSGKNRIVRRIFEHLGYEVVRLDRTVYANLTKKDLPRGRWRYLDEKEIIQLKHLI